MTTTTQIVNIGRMLDLTDYTGDFTDDYDMDAVHADYVAAIQALLPKEATLLGNGEILAECDMQFNLAGDWSNVPRDDDGYIDWEALVESVDVAPIFERHDKSGDA